MRAPFFGVILFIKFYSLHLSQSQPMHFQMSAAMAAPTKGPTIKIHNCCKATPPSKRAGPIERAGFTDVPQPMSTSTIVPTASAKYFS